jgi:hypothetical protein
LKKIDTKVKNPLPTPDGEQHAENRLVFFFFFLSNGFVSIAFTFLTSCVSIDIAVEKLSREIRGDVGGDPHLFNKE